MQRVYNRIYWENEPSTQTPLSETNLNKMDYALSIIDGRVVELAQYSEDAEQAVEDARAQADRAAGYASQIDSRISEAADYSVLSESYAHGGTESRVGEDTDNSKYYSEQSLAHANTAQSYLSSIAAEAEIAIQRLEDALGETISLWQVDITNGHAYYQGGAFNFMVVNGHLMWEVAA